MKILVRLIILLSFPIWSGCNEEIGDSFVPKKLLKSISQSTITFNGVDTFTMEYDDKYEYDEIDRVKSITSFLYGRFISKKEFFYENGKISRIEYSSEDEHLYPKHTITYYYQNEILSRVNHSIFGDFFDFKFRKNQLVYYKVGHGDLGEKSHTIEYDFNGNKKSESVFRLNQHDSILISRLNFEFDNKCNPFRHEYNKAFHFAENYFKNNLVTTEVVEGVGHETHIQYEYEGKFPVSSYSFEESAVYDLWYEKWCDYEYY